MISRRDLLATGSALAATSLIGSAQAQSPALVRKAIPSSGEMIPVIGLGTARRYEDVKSEAEMPPLRERSEDIPDLIRHFFAQAAQEGLPQKQIDQAALDRLKRYRWSGNVRELENLARRLAALYPQETITAAVVDAELAQPAPPTADKPLGEESLTAAVERNLTRYFASFSNDLPPPGLYHRILREIEYPLLSAALAARRGNQIRAADLLGLNHNTLRMKIRDLDIQVIRTSG